MRITSELRDGWTLFVVSGELDLATAPKLREATAPASLRGERLAIDMSGITFIDSSGLQALLELHERGTAPTLIDPSRAVSDLLELTELSNMFPTLEGTSDLEA